MSSHHVVRENQEPALLIFDVDALEEEYLGQLLEWSPIVIASDQHVDFLLARGIKIDVILTAQQNFQVEQDGVLVIRSQDFLTDVMLYLRSRNQFAVHILWNSFQPNVILPYHKEFVVALYSKQVKYIIQPTFDKWMPNDRQISILDTNTDYHIENLEKIRDTLYKSIQTGFVRINSKNDEPLIIGEEL